MDAAAGARRARCGCTSRAHRDGGEQCSRGDTRVGLLENAIPSSNFHRTPSRHWIGPVTKAAYFSVAEIAYLQRSPAWRGDQWKWRKRSYEPLTDDDLKRIAQLALDRLEGASAETEVAGLYQDRLVALTLCQGT